MTVDIFNIIDQMDSNWMILSNKYDIITAATTGIVALVDLAMVYGALKSIKSALIIWEIFAVWNLIIGFYNCYKQIDTMDISHGVFSIIFGSLGIYIVYEVISEISNKKKEIENLYSNQFEISVIGYCDSKFSNLKSFTNEKY